jgi:hypothetical protein
MPEDKNLRVVPWLMGCLFSLSMVIIIHAIVGWAKRSVPIMFGVQIYIRIDKPLQLAPEFMG